MLVSIEEFIKKAKKEQIINKIIELKTKPQTEDVTLLIQKYLSRLII